MHGRAPNMVPALGSFQLSHICKWAKKPTAPVQTKLAPRCNRLPRASGMVHLSPPPVLPLLYSPSSGPRTRAAGRGLFVPPGQPCHPFRVRSTCLGI